MSEPKFSIGDRVAVCTSNFQVVLPATIVRSFRKKPAGYNRDPITSVIGWLPERWSYLVDGCKYFVCEWCLRPIQPDEYTEPSTESREVSA